MAPAHFRDLMSSGHAVFDAFGADMTGAHWDERYRSTGADHLSWFEDEPRASLEILDALGVGPDRSVLDVGGGESCLVDRLLERGHTDLAVLDISAVALADARRRVGDARRVDWIEADVRTWRPSRRWDVWHDRAALHFMVERADRDDYLRALSAAIAPGGSVVLATFAPDGPDQCSGLPVAHYDPEVLSALLAEVGTFDVVAARCDVHTTPWGAAQPFSWLAARRSAG